MTIDKTIDFLRSLEAHTPQAESAREVAIETMRKYQEIVKITDAVQLINKVTKKEAIEELKDATFNDIADELWEYYNFVLDIKSVTEEVEL